MIIGIGVDVCDIRRIRKSLKSYGNDFSNYILTENEIIQGKLNNDFPQYLAARFSVKESFYKAFNKRSQKFLNWQDLEILDGTKNKYKLQMSKKANKLISDFLPLHTSHKVDLSLTFTDNLVFSYVILSYFNNN